MLDLNEANRVAEKAASSILKKIGVSRVFVERTADSSGNEALAVTVVLKRGRGAKMKGDLAGNTIFKIAQDLQKSGDDRFPIVSFATEEEMEADGDPEC